MISKPCMMFVALSIFHSALSASALDIVGRNGTHATIVIPAQPIPIEEYAAQELQYHIQEAAGVTLPIVREGQKPMGTGLIYLGACQQAKKAGITTDQLAPNAGIIQLINGDLFMAGNDSHGPVFSDLWTIHDIRTRVGTLFAVYEFLEKQLRAKWLWPGKSGEVIPKHAAIRVRRWSETWTPPLIHTRLRDHVPYNMGHPEPWSSMTYRHSQAVWLRRQRFAMGANMDVRHAFEDDWNQFGQTHPEFFNLLPDGTHRSDPTVYGGDPGHVSMCVSQPGLWKQIVQKWLATRTAENPFINAGENDIPGKCTCPACMAWDVPDPKSQVPFAERLARAKEAFARGDPAWVRNLGSLSDRYAKFYLAIQKEAEKTDPHATVLGLSYENYVAAPVQTKLNKRIVIAFVPGYYFPWTKEKRDQARAQWDGWHKAGASLMLRPNYFLDGHNMPVFFARKFGEDFEYFARRGMLATDFDSLTGQWATQGPNLYVLARVHIQPLRPVADILDEYYGGFGPAKRAVRNYFRHWEKVSDAVTDKFFDEAMARTKGNPWWGFFILADTIFTPEVMSRGRELLAKAQAAAKSDAVAEERIAFLEKGLRNAELTLAAQVAFRVYKEKGDLKAFRDAVKDLDLYRRSISAENTANPWFPFWAETTGGWDRKLVYP